MFILYKITNKITDSIYFGYTGQTIEERYYDHLKTSKRADSSQILYKAIRKYGCGAFFIETIDTFNSKIIAKEAEIWHIAKHKTNRCRYRNERGYNMTDGGDGGNGYKHTPETIEIMRASATGKWHTEETKKKISKANKGRPCSETQRRVASETHKGKKLSKEHKEFLSRINKNRIFTKEHKQKLKDNAATAREVCQYTKNGELLMTFTQIQHAEDETGIGRANISSVCRGKTKTAGGFIWSYLNK